MMKLNIRPSQKKKTPNITLATQIILKYFIPKQFVGPRIPKSLLPPKQSRYLPHQGKKESARRVKQGQAGTCYQKPNYENCIIEIENENTTTDMPVFLKSMFPLTWKSKKNSRSHKRQNG